MTAKKTTKKDRNILEAKKVIETYIKKLKFKRKLKLRQIFYRLVAKQIIANTISEYKYLSKNLVWARRKGIINPELITDGSRSQPHLPTNEYYCHIEHFEGFFHEFLNLTDYYQISRWYKQPNYVIVALEKDALSEIFNDIVNELECGFVIDRGYNSYSQLHEAMREVKRLSPSKIIFIHFGDFDPSGKDIIRSFIERIEEMGIIAEHKIVALTKEQIIKYQLPSVLTKKTDTRAKNFIERYGDMAVELDALEPDVLENLIIDSVNEFFDQDIYNETVISIEDQNKILLQKTMEKVGENLGDIDDYMTSLQSEEKEGLDK